MSEISEGGATSLDKLQAGQAGTTSAAASPASAGGATTASPSAGGATAMSGSASGATATSVGSGATGERSLGELVKFVSEDLSHLVRSEIRLAQVEVTQKAKGFGAGLGAFGAAGVLALFGVGLLLTTLVLVLDIWLPAWLAALIVTVVVLIIAGIAALVGRKKVSEAAPPVPTRAIESVKDDVQEIKQDVKESMKR